MDLLCKVCDRSIIENESKYNKFDFNIINLDEVDNILNYHITTFNKKFDLFFIKCIFEIEFENNSTAIIEINYHHNLDMNNIKSYFLFYIDSCKLDGYKFIKIKPLTINTITCLCNIAYEFYINNPMPMVERRINFVIAKNPQLINSLDCNKSHPLIRKYSHMII